MSYKLFLPTGATENGNNVTLASGLVLPRFAFIAVPIVGLKGVSNTDLLTSSSAQANVYYDTKSNSFTTTKKIRNVDSTPTGKILDSLSASDSEAFIKYNFDGYINISTLISNIKNTISSIKETQTNLSAYEQDIGYTSVRNSDLIDYTITSIDPADDYTNIDYPLSTNLTLRDMLVYTLKSSTLVSQLGISKKIIVGNLKNLATNVYEPVLKYLLNNDPTNIQIYSGFVENIYYTSDEEFYMGEAVQLSFPGYTPSSVYLIAKDMINSLYFNELYLDYFQNDVPKITVILNGNSQGYMFGTRFEYNLIHPTRLMNLDSSFDISAQDATILADLSLNTSISFKNIDATKDQNALQNFIKDAISMGYVQSHEAAITAAFSANLDISQLSTTVVPGTIDVRGTIGTVPDSYSEGTDYATDYDAPSASSNTYNSILATVLTSLIKCPTVSNGSVSGFPDQSIFPMMSNVGFRTLSDLSMLNNPAKNSGEFGIPRSVRFNNPFLLDVIDGVTNKVEDGFVGAAGGKAVYQNRLGGLIAGLRHMQSQNLNGKTLFSAASAMVPDGLLTKLVANLSQAFFGLLDPTGMILSCAQFDLSNGNVNDQIVLIAMTMAAFTGEKKSPFTYEEIAVALSHVKNDLTQFNKTVDGSPVGTTRTPETELHVGASKLENTPGTAIKDIADATKNGVKALIIDGNGVDIQTKNQRIDNATTAYVAYDVGSDHSDRPDQIGSYSVTADAGTKDSLI